MHPDEVPRSLSAWDLVETLLLRQIAQCAPRQEVHMRRFGWLVLAGAAIACGSGSGGGSSGPAMIDGVQVMAGFDPGVPAPAPSDGFQVILPIISNIQPGASDEWCTWTSFTRSEEQ